MANTILNDLAIRLRVQMAEFQKGMAQAKSSLQGFKNNVSNATKELNGVFQGAASELSTGLNHMTRGLSSMLSAGVKTFKSLAKSVKGFATAFAATGIGAIIIAVGVALAALVSYFKRSGEGADRLAVAVAYLKGLFDGVMKVLKPLGKALVDAFKNPQEAIKNLWNSLKTNILDRLDGVVMMFNGLWEIINNGAKGAALAIKGIFNKEAREEAQKYFDELADGWDKVKDGANQAFGVDLSGLKDAAGVINDAAKASADLARRQNEFARQQIRYNEANAKDAIEVARLRREAEEVDRNTDEGKAKRLELLTKAYEIQERINNRNIALKGTELSLLEDAQKITGSYDITTEQQISEAKIAFLQEQEQAELKLKEIGGQIRETQASMSSEVEKTTEQKRAEAEEAYRLKTTYEGQREAVKALYEEGVIGAAEYADKLKAIDEEFAVEGSDAWLEQQRAAEEEALQNRIDHLNNKLSYEDLSLQEIESIYDEFYAKGIISAEQYYAAIKDLDNRAKRDKIDNVSDWLNNAANAMDVLNNVMQIQMNKELAAAGNNEDKKEAIRRKYAAKQKAMAIGQALINGALAITNIIANTVGSVLNPATWAAIGISTAATAAQVGVIASTPMAKGGLVYGETLATVGEYAGAKSNPEVIAPLSDLKGIIAESINGGMGGEVRFVIEEDKLVGILNRYNKKQIYF